jgi:hypothetical protein
MVDKTLYLSTIRPSKDLLQYAFARKEIKFCHDSLGNPIPTDTCRIQYILNPDKKGLKKLIRNGDFSMSGKYVKMSEP